MEKFRAVGIPEKMIQWFGGIRFRHMNLFSVNGMQLLLGACAEPLESVALSPIDPRGEQPYPKGIRSLVDTPQSVPPFRSLICHRTRQFGGSSSQRGLLILK